MESVDLKSTNPNGSIYVCVLSVCACVHISKPTRHFNATHNIRKTTHPTNRKKDSNILCGDVSMCMQISVHMGVYSDVYEYTGIKEKIELF